MAFCYDYHVVWANEGKVPGLTGKHNLRMVMVSTSSPFTLPQRKARA